MRLHQKSHFVNADFETSHEMKTSVIMDHSSFMSLSWVSNHWPGSNGKKEQVKVDQVSFCLQRIL